MHKVKTIFSIFAGVVFFFSPFFSSRAEQGKSNPETLRVYLDWTPNIEFTGMYTALEKGWYEKEGIDLKMVYNGLNIIPNVLKGEADIGMDSGHDLILHATKNTGLKAFAAKYQLNPNCIVVGHDSGIKSIKDLKGKTLGIFSPQEMGMYQIMLGYNGLTLSDVHFFEIKTFNESELIELLKKKVVDGFIAWEFNWTVTFSLLGYDVKVFPGYENGFDYYGIVYFAPAHYIETHADLLKRFLKVTFDGWREAYKNPEHYAKLVVDKYYPRQSYINGSKELTLKQQMLELKLRKRYFFEGVGEKYMGMMSHAKWAKGLSISKRYGHISQESRLQADDLYDNRVIEQVIRDSRE